MTPETWPVATSPVTGHPLSIDEVLDREDIEIDEVLAVIRRHLVWPAPVRDKALEDT